MYDVIVVGSGPSGASTAYELARLGAKALILEKAKLPRYKTCGGAIPANFFHTLPGRVQNSLRDYMTDCLYLGPEGKSYQPDNASKIAGVLRDEFDHAFTLTACDAGAELVEENPVLKVEEKTDHIELKTKKGIFQSRFLVGADGATGNVRRQLGLSKKDNMAAALEVEVEPDPKLHRSDIAQIHFNLIQDGYAWVFPKGNLHSIGLASFDRGKSQVKEKLKEWLDSSGYRLKGEIIHGHPIPVFRKSKKLSTNRSLLVGDAAGTVDPLVGEGIRYGIRSGRIAAQYLKAALVNDKISPQYSRTIFKEIHSDFVYAKWVARFFYQFPGFCYDMWVRFPASTEVMSKVLFGEMRYRDIFYRVITGLLKPSRYLRLTKPSLKTA